MDIYAEVTDRIVAELESGIIPWNRPWTGVSDGAIRRSNGKPYSLINQFLLGKPGEYLTFNQCKREGGKVKKGSKAKIVVFWKILKKDKTNADGSIVRDENGMPVPESVPMLRYYQVFHIDDCEGISPKYAKDEEKLNPISPIDAAESALSDYVRRTGVGFENLKQDRAYYSPTRGIISLPLMEQFGDAESYYDTAFHEAVHSTGHKSRLNRFEENAMAAAFGSESYSKEELVAEIGACGILHELGMETAKSFRNNAAYVQSWLKALKNDKKLIISATSRAEKAIRLILNIEDKAEEE